jgi:putative hydrolase of the HAD superfamily
MTGGPGAHQPTVTRSPLRAVLFDAGNTLVRIDYAAIVDHLAARGHATSAAAVEEAEIRARVQVDDEVSRGRSTESRDTQARYFGLVLEHLGITGAAEHEAIAAWRRTFNAPLGPWHVRDASALAALARARAAGLAAGVISNSNGSIREILDRAGLLSHVDVVIDSSVVGVEKPDPRIFQLGLDAVKVPASAAAYVGDLYSVDVLGARGAGLEGVLIDPRGHWGARDCLQARDADHAVQLLLESAGSPGARLDGD